MSDGTAPSRYVRVKHASLAHPKFLGLTAAERGTWLVALLLADIAHPDPVYEAAVLEKCPDATFDRLYDRGLLEVDGIVGAFYVHDLKHVYPSDTPEQTAERKRRQRARSRDVTSGHDSHDSHVDHDIRDETRRDDIDVLKGSPTHPAPAPAKGGRYRPMSRVIEREDD